MLIKKLLVSISIILMAIGISLSITSTSINLYTEAKKYIGINNYLNNKQSSYLYVLEIPSINLKQGIGTNINKELIMINNNIIAGHSGHCKMCFFNKLDQIEIGDIVYLYTPYKKIYYVSKINIYDKDKIIINNELNLVTCLKLDSTKRLVIGLNSKE